MADLAAPAGLEGLEDLAGPDKADLVEVVRVKAVLVEVDQARAAKAARAVEGKEVLAVRADLVASVREAPAASASAGLVDRAGRAVSEARGTEKKPSEWKSRSRRFSRMVSSSDSRKSSFRFKVQWR